MWLLLMAVAAAPVDQLEDAVRRQAPKSIRLAAVEGSKDRLSVLGVAPTHEAVADFMRAISAIVRTPRGLGRIVERAREGTSIRVELFLNLVQQDFAANEVGPFACELVKADSKSAKARQHVTFELIVTPK